MMAISEEMEEETDSEEDKENVAPEMNVLFNNEGLRCYLQDMLKTAEDLNILDIVRTEGKPSGGNTKTKQTTAKYKPGYVEKTPLLGTRN